MMKEAWIFEVLQEIVCGQRAGRGAETKMLQRNLVECSGVVVLLCTCKYRVFFFQKTHFNFE